MDLKKIEIPRSVTKIGTGCFQKSGLEKIKLNDGLEYIEDYAFFECENLKEIEIPSSIKEINNNAFKGSSLEKIKLNEGIKYIRSETFKNCENLKEIEIPSSIKSLSNSLFYFANNLTLVKLSEGLERIETCCFFSCGNLNKINFPKTLKFISNNAFFYNVSLKNIKLNEGLISIGESAFVGCKSLIDIKFPATLKRIENNAFDKCYNLKSINIPKDTLVEDYSFDKRKDYDRIFMYDLIDNLNKKWITPFSNKNNSNIFKNEKTGEYLIQNINIKEVPNGFKKFAELDEYAEKIKCDRDIASIYYEAKYTIEEYKKKHLNEELLRNIINKETIETFKNIHDSKNFNLMYKRIIKNIDFNSENKKIFSRELFKFAYNLGAFEKDDKVRQRACNYIENLFDKKVLNEKNIISIFNVMKLDGYKPDWANFVMDKDNINRMLDKECEKNFFISLIYNNFEKIQEFNRSNRGNQHYKKATIEVCETYLSEIIFDGETEYTKDIVSVIKDYSRKQETFNEAKSIREEYIKLKEEGKIRDHILNEELKEIELVKEDTLKDISETLTNLNEVSNKKFTYEFLSKYDPRNFVLGKYCNCCAHLEGDGYGIMKASILHPSCQNLIIKDSSDRIIAKSTLYINEEQGYGLFNNVEVDDDGYISLKSIYETYKKAILDFVKKYNENPDKKPLTQINVGMHFNDLVDEIMANDEKGEILNGIDFSHFGKKYAGDWQEEQYILWKK